MTFYFYDLETSGFNPRDARIMQFAGQRTDMDLNPVGKPDNYLIKITPDVLPEPDAVLVTGITPQKTLAEGISEAEFLKLFYDSIATKDTIFVGFNNIRFDDEFIRYANYRNFYDAYEWQWSEGRSKWDILDVVRMTRALRPDGIEWPFASDGKPANKLELIAAVNKLEHEKAHDALSDVYATIGVAKLIKSNQPKLFDYLLKVRDKKEVQKIISSGEPFVYTSGRYSSDYAKTTLAVPVAQHPTQTSSVYVYDLRYDPTPFIDMTPTQLAENLSKWKFEENELRLPVKLLQTNRCPAVAPQQVLDDKTKERLQINDLEIKQHLQTLLAAADFADKLSEAARLNEKQKQASFIVDVKDVDAQLYDGFFNDGDKSKMRVVRASNENDLADLHLDFADERLTKLLTLYKARQYPKSLTTEEQKIWEEFKIAKLTSGEANSKYAKYISRLQQLANEINEPEKQYILEELSLYGQSIMPYDS